MLVSEAQYNSVHLWLREMYGPANHCENATCDGMSKRLDWALKAGKSYQKKRSAFMQMCRRCHARYDRENDNINKVDRRFCFIRITETTHARLKAKAAKKRKKLYEIVDEGEKLVKV